MATKNQAAATKNSKTKRSAPAAKKAISLVAPVPPKKEREDKPVKDSTAASLGKARKLLEWATSDYNFQSRHLGNAALDFTKLYQRLTAFHATFREKAILKSTRDLGFDWQKFVEEVTAFRSDLFELVIDHMNAKATRMVETGTFTDFELGEMWGEAQREDRPRDQIRGWSNLIHNLKALGCYDPEDQPRGGRQSGGTRRRG